MSEEKSLKLEGEELARVAVSSGMGAKQLQTIYRLIKTRPLAFVEAFVQRQIGREVKGFRGFVEVLGLLRKYEKNKIAFEKVLMYAVMLYDYCEKEPIMKFRSASESLIKRVVESRGAIYDSVTMKLRGNVLEINVKVRKFYGNRKALAMEIERALNSKEEFSNLKLRIWIESR
jgi:hypothetical protein